MTTTDPRLTQLTVLVHALLADYETATGQPHHQADDVRTALAEVERIPEKDARRRAWSALTTRRAGWHAARRR